MEERVWTTKDKDERERLNHQAYKDVLDCVGPSYPDDEVYMCCYRFWYPLGQEYKQDLEYVGYWD